MMDGAPFLVSVSVVVVFAVAAAQEVVATVAEVEVAGAALAEHPRLMTMEIDRHFRHLAPRTAHRQQAAGRHRYCVLSLTLLSLSSLLYQPERPGWEFRRPLPRCPLSQWLQAAAVVLQEAMPPPMSDSVI